MNKIFFLILLMVGQQLTWAQEIISAPSEDLLEFDKLLEAKKLAAKKEKSESKKPNSRDRFNLNSSEAGVPPLLPGQLPPPGTRPGPNSGPGGSPGETAVPPPAPHNGP